MLFAQLKQVAGVAEPNATIISISETADTWDDLAFNPVLTEADISTFNSEPPQLATHSTPNISNDIGPFYARCRSSLLLLQADQSILSQFRVLNKKKILSAVQQF